MTKPARSLPHFAEPDVERIERDGDMLLRSRTPISDYAVSVSEWLQRWAQERPGATFLAERPRGDPAQPWRTISYADMWQRASSVGQALLDLRLSQQKPLAIVSGASIDHAT